jgi:hypothetical protein
MVKQFEIIHTKLHHNRGLFIFARHLGVDHNFKVTDGALLRDLPVYHYSEIQPKADESDEPQKGIFVFRPADMNRLFDNSFEKGAIVTLTFSE